MKNYILILLFFSIKSVLGQEKILYIFCDDESICNKQEVVKQIGDTIVNYTFFKTIPGEQYKYT